MDPTPRSGGARGRRGGAGLASRSQRHRHCVGWAGRPRLGRGVRTRRGHPHPRLDRVRRAASPRPGVRAEDVDGLWWGTTRPPFAEGPSWSHLAASLRLGPSAVGAVAAGSPHAGVEALLAAADAIAAGTVRPGHRRHQRRAAARHRHVARARLRRGRDGGAARAGRRTARPPLLGPRASRWMAALDRYRGDHEDTTRDVYDGRLFREEIFLPLATETAAALGHRLALVAARPRRPARLGARPQDRHRPGGLVRRAPGARRHRAPPPR